MTDNRKTRDFLLRDLPTDLADKLKVAASLHHAPMKAYIQGVLEGHVRELEKKGITLSLPKGKG
jgi:plasmid stability protein